MICRMARPSPNLVDYKWKIIINSYSISFGLCYLLLLLSVLFDQHLCITDLKESYYFNLKTFKRADVSMSSHTERPAPPVVGKVSDTTIHLYWTSLPGHPRYCVQEFDTSKSSLYFLCAIAYSWSRLGKCVHGFWTWRHDHKPRPTKCLSLSHSCAVRWRSNSMEPGGDSHNNSYVFLYTKNDNFLLFSATILETL